MAIDLDQFLKAMDGEWVSVRHEIAPGDEGRVRVHYRSLLHPDIEWSHCPFRGQPILPIGTRGRLGFVAASRYSTIETHYQEF